MTIRQKFKQQYFKDIHTKLVDYVHSKIQVRLPEQDTPDIDEYFMQDNSENSLERWLPKIDNNLKVIKNKSHNPFKVKLAELHNIILNPQFDLRILGPDYKMIYANFEMKSRLNPNKLNKNEVYQDFQRLALFKSLFPQTICSFMSAGLFKGL